MSGEETLGAGRGGVEGRFDTMRLVTATAALLTFTVGLLGNGAVLVVIGRNAHHIRVKSVANSYIWTLALADLLYVLALPLVAWATYIDRCDRIIMDRMK